MIGFLLDHTELKITLFNYGALYLAMIMEPIFILCTPRSGSTLLRYILDTHKDIFCPPEPHLGMLAKKELGDRPIASLDETEKERIRNKLEEKTMSDMPDERSIWCDKSVTTLDHIELISELYPEARYIILRRHCLDFVHSANEVITDGVRGYGFEEEIFKTNDHIVEALVNYWIRTNDLMSEVLENDLNAYEIKYESVVSNPETEVSKLLSFLKLEPDDQLVDNVFHKPHEKGRGDHKIHEMHQISDQSIGKGQLVNPNLIDKELFMKLNDRLEKLKYQPVDRTWSETLPIHLTWGKNELVTSSINYFIQYFTDRVKSKLSYESAEMDIRDEFLLFIKDLSDPKIICSYSEPYCWLDAAANVSNRVTTDFVSFMAILDGRLSFGSALRSGRLSVTGDMKVINTYIHAISSIT